jgi:hypothetical protein
VSHGSCKPSMSAASCPAASCKQQQPQGSHAQPAALPTAHCQLDVDQARGTRGQTPAPLHWLRLQLPVRRLLSCVSASTARSQGAGAPGPSYSEAPTGARAVS